MKILPTIYQHLIKRKRYENLQSDHLKENSLIFYQILSANSLKKCVEVITENLYVYIWAEGLSVMRQTI